MLPLRRRPLLDRQAPRTPRWFEVFGTGPGVPNERTGWGPVVRGASLESGGESGAAGRAPAKYGIPNPRLQGLGRKAAGPKGETLRRQLSGLGNHLRAVAVASRAAGKAVGAGNRRSTSVLVMAVASAPRPPFGPPEAPGGPRGGGSRLKSVLQLFPSAIVCFAWIRRRAGAAPERARGPPAFG